MLLPYALEPVDWISMSLQGPIRGLADTADPWKAPCRLTFGTPPEWRIE